VLWLQLIKYVIAIVKDKFCKYPIHYDVICGVNFTSVVDECKRRAKGNKARQGYFEKKII